MEKENKESIKNVIFCFFNQKYRILGQKENQIYKAVEENPGLFIMTESNEKPPRMFDKKEEAEGVRKEMQWLYPEMMVYLEVL